MTDRPSDSRPSMEEVNQLVEDLENTGKKNSKGKAYKRVYNLYDSDKKVVSWKFNEWDYGRNNLTLPCNARGLFISDDETNPEIVARGYDKFFNIDEVYMTKWDWIQKNTKGPYEVTLKSNGCIILISGLKDGTLVVCSKHSTGPRDDVDRNHAETGRQHVFSQLKSKGIDPKTFARKLYVLNVTAVAEFCDDSFEEHILEYKGANAGLYLHGVNYNQRKFKTWSMDSVTAFASEYGFKTTEYFKEEDIDSLKNVLNKCSKNGSYQGIEVEGFVIRSKLNEADNDFFFKYKFEEPYLMYRQWREVTKDYIATRSRVFNFRKHKFITNKYLDFVIPLLEQDQKLCEEYVKGFGIIRLRNMFLENYGMTGIEILNYSKICELQIQNSIDFDKVDEHTKFLIFPIAVIGCGKTTTSLTLKNLYPESWGVVQNDDITCKDKSMLMKKSLQLLANDKIKCVIVDRNNHQYRERKQLFDWLTELKEEFLPYDTNIKVIALSFFSYDDIQEVKDLTISRVLARGDNHQSIKSGAYGEKKVLGIMNGFINRFQPVDENRLPDSMFDLIINLQVSEINSSLTNASQIVEEIHRMYPVLIPEVPSNHELVSAFEHSLLYKPKITKIVKSRSQDSGSKKFKPAFFAASIRDRAAIIDEISRLTENYPLDENVRSGIDELFKYNKFQKEFHITLAHVSQGKNGSLLEKELWNKLKTRYENFFLASIKGKDSSKLIKTNDFLHFKLKKLCWDSRIVSMMVEFPEKSLLDSTGQVISDVPCCNKIPHITIGVLDKNTRPYYSNELCEKVETDGSDLDVHCLDFKTETTFEADICINL